MYTSYSAVGAIQSYLVKKVKKFISINVKSSECLDTHYYAVLIGAGATTVNAYLAIDSIYQRFERVCLENFLLKSVSDVTSKQLMMVC